MCLMKGLKYIGKSWGEKRCAERCRFLFQQVVVFMCESFALATTISDHIRSFFLRVTRSRMSSTEDMKQVGTTALFWPAFPAHSFLLSLFCAASKNLSCFPPVFSCYSYLHKWCLPGKETTCCMLLDTQAHLCLAQFHAAAFYQYWRSFVSFFCLLWNSLPFPLFAPSHYSQ